MKTYKNINKFKDEDRVDAYNDQGTVITAYHTVSALKEIRGKDWFERAFADNRIEVKWQFEGRLFQVGSFSPIQMPTTIYTTDGSERTLEWMNSKQYKLEGRDPVSWKYNMLCLDLPKAELIDVTPPWEKVKNIEEPKPVIFNVLLKDPNILVNQSFGNIGFSRQMVEDCPCNRVIPVKNCGENRYYWVDSKCERVWTIHPDMIESFLTDDYYSTIWLIKSVKGITSVCSPEDKTLDQIRKEYPNCYYKTVADSTDWLE